MAAETQPETPAPRRWKRPSAGAALGLAATIVGLVSAIIGLVFLFAPDLQPSGEPEEQAATLSHLQVRPNASFREYLSRVDLPPTGYTPAQLARRGALLQFRIRTNGFEGNRLILKWELYDEASGEQVNESKATILKPTNKTNEANWRFWVPVPHRPGPFYAVVELQQQKKDFRLPLDSIESKPFAGLT